MVVFFFEEIDNRGLSLFVTLTYKNEITKNTILKEKDSVLLESLLPEVVFVALKNGHHDETGYYIDSSLEKNRIENNDMPVSSLFDVVMEHFNIGKEKY